MSLTAIIEFSLVRYILKGSFSVSCSNFPDAIEIHTSDLYFTSKSQKNRKGHLENFCLNREFKPFPSKSWFLCVCSTSLLKTRLEKEKLLVISIFSFSHSVWRTFCHFHLIWNCRLQPLSVSKTLTFVVWEKVKIFILKLTLYHAITTFNDPDKEACWKHYGKKRKCWFSQNVFCPSQNKLQFFSHINFILLSAGAFNLDQAKNLSFGKELEFRNKLF